MLEIPRERTESIEYSRDVKQALEFRSGAANSAGVVRDDGAVARSFGGRLPLPSC